jgi:hypothetical protein
MKKLLALVLCVMMFVSVLSTAAFADAEQPFPATTATAKWMDLSVANKAISNSKKNIEYIYGTLAADNAVFGTVKAMDSVVTDLVKGLFADLEDGYSVKVAGGKNVYSQSLLEKNAKRILRNALGGEVASYMYDHLGNYASVSTHIELGGGNKLTSTGVGNINGFTFYLSDTGDIYAVKSGVPYIVDMTGIAGTQAEMLEQLQYAGAGRFTEINPVNYTVVQDYQYDPIKYANAFATAVTKALSSEKGAANISAYAYALMQTKVAKDVNDKMDDLATAIADWEDGTRILGQYGFADFDALGYISVDPYAFIDPTNLPKASFAMPGLLVDDGTVYFIAD